MAATLPELSKQTYDSTAAMKAERIYSDSSCSSSPWKYDVFLSFRGEDTRKNFVDHLYAALNQKGIYVFRDDKELERGKAISPALLKAIEESRFSIVVFSRNYASSTWCLDELVKIVGCKNTLGQTVLPIFYDVDPSVVRKQVGIFETFFAEHEKVFKHNVEKVQNWRSALKEVANLSGWDAKDRHETSVIEDIIKDIESKLNRKISMTFEDLVGTDSRSKELRFLIDTGSIDIRMIGICGMGGIGKTTIARVVFELICHEFEASIFLANVREISEKGGLVSLQEQLLSKALRGRHNNIYNVYDGKCELRRRLKHKKVLIVVDDVDHEEQLNALVGKPDWFGLGSRIIITTRNKHLLETHGIDEVYEVKELNHDEALQLLILKAFKNHQPSKDYMDLSKRVVKYTAGLPLALEVLSSFLFGKTVKEWEDALERLKRDLEKGIFEALRISFDGLNETEKKIFLDIACFFKGKNRDYVMKILDGCGLNPTIGIKVLITKSLITISKDDKLWMHDLLQEMGQQIVKKESLNESGKRSRLWEEADVHHVLTKNTGSEVVEGIMLNYIEEQVHCSPKAFSKMRNLRLLKICNVQLRNGLEYLSDELSLLDWDDYPLKSLPDNMKLDKVVELNLRRSHIKQLSKENKPFNVLTCLNLTNCQYLKKTPDFAGAPNLEEVILNYCIRLHEIHPSLLLHKKITNLNLQSCTSLATLPNKIHMESLQELELSCCSKLKYFPEIVGSMGRLSEIHLNETAIKELPMSIGFLTGLQLLDLNECRNLVSLPISINGLKSLQRLHLQDCSRLESLPDTLGELERLVYLYVRRAPLRQVMSSIFLIKKLYKLDFDGCKGSPSNSLSAVFSTLSFMPIRSSGLMAFRLPSLSGLFSPLIKLSLSNCNLDEEAIPNDFFRSFPSLEKLDLSNNNFVSLPRSINHLSKLEYLNVNGCTSLVTLSNALGLGLWNLKLGISCVNCLKLMEDHNMAFSILKEQFNKAMLKQRDKFGVLNLLMEGEISDRFGIVVPGSKILEWYSGEAMLKMENKYGFLKLLRRLKGETFGSFRMIVPGSEIPEWFSHKCEGFHSFDISIKRPPYVYNNSKLVGCLVCFVIDLYSADYSFQVSCVTRNIHFARVDINVESASEHLVLIFFPPKLPDYFHMMFGYDDDGSWFSLDTSWQEEVKRWGVHMVYEEDVEEFNKIDNHSTWWNLKESHQDDNVGSTAEEDNAWY